MWFLEMRIHWLWCVDHRNSRRMLRDNWKVLITKIFKLFDLIVVFYTMKTKVKKISKKEKKM